MFKQIFYSADQSRSNYFNKNQSAGFIPTPNFRVSLHSKRGFTVIELLVVISIIGFIAVSSVVIFNIVRMNARDAVRVGNIATITRALAIYLNDSGTGYPPSTGECLKVGSEPGGVGNELKDKQVLLTVPTDPLWPTALPGSISNGLAISPSNNFCYYYYSEYSNQYKISFYLESNSKFGNAGINATVVGP